MKVYLKVLTGDINPGAILDEIDNKITISKKMVKWESIGIKWWKYWYNWFIVWWKSTDYVKDIKYFMDISKKIKFEWTNMEKMLVIDISNNSENVSGWIYLDRNTILKLYENHIDIDVIY